MSLPATDVDALLAKLNQYRTGRPASGADASLSDTELTFLREQLTTKKKYGLIWEDKPEAVEQQLRESLPVLTEVTERWVENRKKSKTEQETIQPVSAPTGIPAQLPLAFVSDKSASLVD